MSKISELALQIAITQIGEEEKPRGSNWGIPVQDYLASVGINFPASWCMALVYWCFEKAAIELGMFNQLYKTGGVLMQWNKSTMYHKNTPSVGDIFIMDFGGGLGHTGMIEKIDEDGTLHTIEGNTNDTGSREGFEVCRRMRSQKNMKGYLSF